MSVGRLARKSESDRLKADRERRVFECFLSDLEWPPGDVINMPTPAPDILYKVPGEKPIAFELAELADQNFTHSIARGHEGFMEFQSPVKRIIKKKWEKKYLSEFPIHLLLYIANRAALWDDDAENELILWCNALPVSGPFCCVWFWGSDKPRLVWQRASQSAQ